MSSTSLSVSTGAVNYYLASMMNLIWFTDKNVHRISTKQHGGMKSGVSRYRLNHLASSVCWCVLSCSKVQKSSYPHKCVKVIVWGVFVSAMVKLQQFTISKADEVRHCSRVAIQQVCQHRLRQDSLYSRHTMTSALRHD